MVGATTEPTKNRAEKVSPRTEQRVKRQLPGKFTKGAVPQNSPRMAARVAIAAFLQGLPAPAQPIGRDDEIRPFRQMAWKFHSAALVSLTENFPRVAGLIRGLARADTAFMNAIVHEGPRNVCEFPDFTETQKQVQVLRGPELLAVIADLSQARAANERAIMRHGAAVPVPQAFGDLLVR